MKMFSIFEDGLSKPAVLQCRKAVFQPLICYNMFWMVYLMVLAKKLHWMMMMLETMSVLANLATKLSMAAGIFVLSM